MFENITAAQWVSIVLGLLLFVSEALPFTEKVKANGIFQAIVNIIKVLRGQKVE